MTPDLQGVGAGGVVRMLHNMDREGVRADPAFRLPIRFAELQSYLDDPAPFLAERAIEQARLNAEIDAARDAAPPFKKWRWTPGCDVVGRDFALEGNL